MVRFIFFVAMLSSLGIARALAEAPVQTDPQGPDLGIGLCSDSRTPVKLDETVRSTVIRAIAPAANGKTVALRIGPCEGKIPDSTCYAGDKFLMCRISSVERILRAAAWGALKYQESGATSYDAFRTNVPRWNVSAFQYADGVAPEANIDRALGSLREAYRRYQTTDSSHAASSVTRTELMFTATVDFALAALVGHEITHASGEKCPLADKARAEESGLISRLISLQQNGELFCARPPSPEEVRADVCGMRHLRRANKVLVQRNADARTMQIARRLGADLIAFETTFGWSVRPEIPAGKYPFMELEQYLYAPMRVLAFSAELGSDGSGKPAVCGEAASLFVHGTQELFQRCKDGGGNVSDDILALLPKGVETSWNGAPWTPASYSCE